MRKRAGPYNNAVARIFTAAYASFRFSGPFFLASLDESCGFPRSLVFFFVPPASALCVNKKSETENAENGAKKRPAHLMIATVQVSAGGPVGAIRGSWTAPDGVFGRPERVIPKHRRRFSAANHDGIEFTRSLAFPLPDSSTRNKQKHGRISFYIGATRLPKKNSCNTHTHTHRKWVQTT